MATSTAMQLHPRPGAHCAIPNLDKIRLALKAYPAPTPEFPAQCVWSEAAIMRVAEAAVHQAVAQDDWSAENFIFAVRHMRNVLREYRRIRDKIVTYADLNDHPKHDTCAARCARCGVPAKRQKCVRCDGEGAVEDQDPERAFSGMGKACPDCEGEAIVWVCSMEEKWCIANPLAGRGGIDSNTIEGHCTEKCPTSEAA